MTETEKQERETAFLAMVLIPEERELYYKFGHLRENELPTDTDIPHLYERMCGIWDKLAVAGMYDESFSFPRETRSLDEYFWRRSYPRKVFAPFVSTFVEFAVLRGGHKVCFDAIPWWKAVEFIFKENGLGAWPMNDEPMTIHIGLEAEWCEIHARHEIPAILDAFKNGISQFFELLCYRSEEHSEFEFPLFEQVRFEIPCRGGLKVFIQAQEEVNGQRGDAIYLEAWPLTDAEKGLLASEEYRDIRVLRRY